MAAVFMIALAIFMFPLIKDSVESAITYTNLQSSNVSSPYDAANSFSATTLSLVPYFFIAVTAFMVFIMIWRIFSNDDGVDMSDSIVYTKKENITPKIDKPRYPSGRMPDKEKYIYGNDDSYKEDYFKKSKFD